MNGFAPAMRRRPRASSTRPVHRKPTREELFGLFDHLERELADSGFLYPPAKYDSVVRSMRATVHRAKLTYQEVQTIRGMIVALVKNKHRVKKE